MWQDLRGEERMGNRHRFFDHADFMEPQDDAEDPGKIHCPPIVTLYKEHIKRWRPVIMRSLGDQPLHDRFCSARETAPAVQRCLHFSQASLSMVGLELPRAKLASVCLGLASVRPPSAGPKHLKKRSVKAFVETRKRRVFAHWTQNCRPEGLCKIVGRLFWWQAGTKRGHLYRENPCCKNRNKQRDPKNA